MCTLSSIINKANSAFSLAFSYPTSICKLIEESDLNPKLISLSSLCSTWELCGNNDRVSRMFQMPFVFSYFYFP